MLIRLFNAKRLAQELNRKEVGPRARGYYLLASFLIFTVFFYSGLVSGNPVYSWMSGYEAVVTTLINVVGLAKTYDAAGGDSNPEFIVEFTCLYVPVSVTTVIPIWVAFWGVTVGFRESIIALSSSHLQFAVNLFRIGGDLFSLLAFLAVVLSQAITFYRINQLLLVVHAESGS